MSETPVSTPRPLHQRLTYVLAVGFGLGLAPAAPGTFGSLLGPPLVWLVQNCGIPLPGQTAVAVVLILLGAPICRIGAEVLGKKDPGAVVYDEIVSFFLVFAAVPVTWLTALLGFGLFRLFDITKPWPARQFESLPAGWGIMADDLVAGLYAGALLTPIWFWVLPALGVAF